MPMVELLPLELLTKQSLPSSLDGSRGVNRSADDTPLISAHTDMEAIECWLAEYANRPTTVRNYRKDGERLLLWSIVERNKPLSSLTGDDLLAYSEFLANPLPRERWCGAKLARRGKRWSGGWKPFVGALSPAAKAASLRNITSLFNFLVSVHYLKNNPMTAVRRQLKQLRFNDERVWQVQARVLDIEEWFALQETLEQMPELSNAQRWEKIRLRYVVALLYFAGLRVDELVRHTMGAFRKIRDMQTGKDRWWLYIVRKGGKLKRIPVNHSLLAELKTYRQFLNFSELPENDEIEPLVRSQETGKGITARRINQLLKILSHQAATHFVSTHPEKAVRLQKFSAHWLRHLSFSMQGLINITKQNIKENAGHESDQTTETYLHAFDNQRHDELERLTWGVEALSTNSMMWRKEKKAV